MASVQKAAWAAAFSCFTLACTHASAGDSVRHFQVEAYREAAGDQRLVSYRLTCAPVLPTGIATERAIVAACVRAALSSRGMYEAPPGTVPDQEVTVTFHIETRTENASPFSRRFRPVTHRLQIIDIPMADAAGITRRTPQEFLVPVDDGYIASRTVPRRVTMFAKRLEISARATADQRMPRCGQELWRVHVSNKDEHANPDEYARLMARAAAGFIAAATDGREKIVLHAGEQSVVLASARE